MPRLPADWIDHSLDHAMAMPSLQQQIAFRSGNWSIQAMAVSMAVRRAYVFKPLFSGQERKGIPIRR